MTDVAFSCRCKAVQGIVHELTPSAGTHAVCYCDSCRAAELVLGMPDPGGNGVHVFQTTPDRISFSAGQEKVAPMSFSENGLLRWRATCCDTPMFNTVRSPKMSFVGILTAILADPAAVGPVVGWAFVPKGDGKTAHRGLYHLAFRAIMRIAKQRLTGRWKQTPFFDVAQGTPVQPVTVLPKGTRAKVLGAAS